MLACNCSQNLQISQHIEYLVLFTQDPLKCQSCILFEHLSPSLSLSDLLNAPSKIVIFISFVQRNRLSPALFGDWLECQRSAFHGQRCWSLRNVLIFFFLFSFEFNELPKHKSVTTAAHKCPNQDFWMRFITNSNWCWVLWRRSRLQKHRNK